MMDLLLIVGVFLTILSCDGFISNVKFGTTTPHCSHEMLHRQVISKKLLASPDCTEALSVRRASSESIKLVSKPEELSKLSAVEDTTVGGSTLRSLYKFTRPHTIRGTILASITGVARALMENPTKISLTLVPRAVLGMVALLLGNAYIVGINQIYDIDIDKVNKPFLPIASGELNKSTAWVVVASSAVIGTAIVTKFFSPLIIGLYCFGLTIGGLYSVPPFQFKRNPLLAGLTIACVRGFLLNFGVYYAVKEALSIPFKWNPTVIFLARFMTVFAGIIAITKDLPDIEGDKKYNVSTFATRLGVGKIAKYASIVLGLNYFSAIANAIFAPAGHFKKPVMIIAHTLFAGYLFKSYKALDPESTTSIKEFYGRIWDLFYAQYCIYPFI